MPRTQFKARGSQTKNGPWNRIEECIRYMKVESNGKILAVRGLTELAASNSTLFRDQVRAAVGAEHKNVEVDLSQTSFVDSCGLGALVAIHKLMCGRNGTVRLLNPTPPVQQILELTRMHRIFEVLKR